MVVAAGFSGGPLAVGTDSVYVIDYGSGGRLLRIAKSDGTIYPIASGSVLDTAVFGDSVYWTTSTIGETDGRVTVAALDGSSARDIATGQATAAAIFVDASGVYWVTGSGKGGGAIMRIGPADVSPVSFASGLPNPNSISGDASNIYWLTTGAIGDGSDGALYFMSKSGGGPIVIAPAQHNAGGSGRSLVASGGRVYWDPRGLVDNDGAVRSAPAAPMAMAPVTEYASHQVQPQAIAVDGSFVYWSDYGNGTDGLIQRASLATNVVTQIAGGLVGPTGIRVDGAVLYFTTIGSGTTPGGLFRLVL